MEQRQRLCRPNKGYKKKKQQIIYFVKEIKVP
jgi:hypothetical protein